MTQQEFITYLQKNNKEDCFLSMDLVFEYTDPLIDNIKYNELTSIVSDFIAHNIAVELCVALLTNLLQIREHIDNYISLRAYTEKELMLSYTKENVQSILHGL